MCAFVNILEVETNSREREYVSLVAKIRSLYDASSVIMVQNHQTEGKFNQKWGILS